MKPMPQILACLLILGLLPATDASAGWVIEQVVRPSGGGEADRHVLTISADRMRTMNLDRSGKPAAAWIMDLDAQTLVIVDYEKRTAATGTVREYAEAVRGATQAASGQMAEAMKQMQEAMQQMPPEQRQMMEQMMRQQMPGGAPMGRGPSAEACREPKVEVRPTGQTARIAGYATNRYNILEDGKLAQEVWLTKAITALQEIDFKKLERFTREMARAMEGLPGCGQGKGRRAGMNPNDPTWKLASEGYPVRTVEHGEAAGTVVEVIKAESRAVPLTEFQPPAGFTRQTLKELMTGR